MKSLPRTFLLKEITKITWIVIEDKDVFPCQQIYIVVCERESEKASLNYNYKLFLPFRLDVEVEAEMKLLWRFFTSLKLSVIRTAMSVP